MPASQNTPEEIARRGRDLYERQIGSRLWGERRGEVLVINVETGGYEIALDHLTAARRARARFGAAPLFAMRVGFPALARIGGRTTTRRTP